MVAAFHQGVSPSLKAALAQTTGTYIGLVDSDDLLAPTALEETVAVLEANPSLGFVYTDYIDINSQGKVIGYGKRCHIPYSKERLLLDFMTFHFRLMRRVVYEQVGGIDESIAHVPDYDICLKFSEIAPVQHLTKPLYYYRQHQASICSQQRIELDQNSVKAIAKALKRRRLAERFQVNLEILSQSPYQSRVRLTAKKPALHLSCLTLGTKVLGMLLPLTCCLSPTFAQVQPITPARDGTNTIIQPTGNRVDITGGQLSKDGSNLFHSFTDFNVNQNQTANFLSNPSIRNILGRINGGNPSIINGILQVTGGNSNLFLMNPAGFLFGPTAQLNLPAAFTATTANGIGFGSNWFNATGANAYTALVGTPSVFGFTTSGPGAIVNAGQLAVGAGQNLTLVGGTVVNTGQITATGGQIILTSVPGENLVRLSQPGHLLNLEITPPNSGTLPNNWTLPILSLPQLLTGTGNATGLSVNSNNQVGLTGSSTQIPTSPGTTIVSGNLNTSGQTGGTVYVLGNTVGLIGANINASGTNGGGTVLVGGDYQGHGIVPNADRTYISKDSTINADSLINGNGGRIIVWANQATGFLVTSALVVVVIQVMAD